MRSPPRPRGSGVAAQRRTTFDRRPDTDVTGGFMKLNAVALLGAVAALSQPAFATNYTQDLNLTHFTAGITNYATFSNFSAGDVGSPFTPTSAELASTGARVYAGGSLPGLS